MKKSLTALLICSGLLFFCTASQAQVLKNLGNKVKQKAGQKADEKVDKTIDKGLDEVENGTKVKKDEDGETKEEKNDGTTIKTDADGNAKVKNAHGSKEKDHQMTFNSKYDFVPGEKIIAFEDFSGTEIGDFPTRWNTNATAEVVTINNKEGKWLKIAKEGAFHPEFVTNVPDNFTLEFDLAVNTDWRGTHFAVNFANLSKPEEFTDYYHYVTYRGKYAVHMELKPGQSGQTTANSRLQAASDGNYAVNNNVDFKGWDNADKNFVHIAMWRQGQRLRVYANGEKIWDVPRAFDATSKFNAVTFGMQDSYAQEDYMLLGNIRLAVGAPDTRNKLMTEGKFVTRGILFDVNSDKIKPESSGALKDIANVLKENAGVKVKIVGHTDSDGDDKANLILSEKRAAAVKNYLVQGYGIDETNLTTEGKGESQLADQNQTPEGKANNRRVEFVKL
jgi:outer membrane protein OmpA-like peptidoglycan-associated protein